MFEEVYPKLSVKNSKLGAAIPTINLQVGKTCRPDAPCFKSCYARKGNMARANVKTCYEKNYEAYMTNPIGYFNVIDAYLTMVPYRFFRYHSSGDIVDMEYLDLMCKLARKHKETKFLCFTKKHEIVNEYLNEHKRPGNLILVFSNWLNWQCPNPHNLPTSWVKFDETTEIPKGAMECSGFCGDCVMANKGGCWRLGKGESVYFNKH